MSILDTLWGYDVFISYKRSEATPYAESLVSELHQWDFRCFLDRTELVS